MPNLAFELEQLEKADRHIESAGTTIAHLRDTLEQERQRGFPTTDGERALQAAIEGLAVFQEHRRLIVQNIDDIRAGRLPST
jgi:DNA-binding IclR family transcriptional regulator